MTIFLLERMLGQIQANDIRTLHVYKTLGHGGAMKGTKF